MSLILLAHGECVISGRWVGEGGLVRDGFVEECEWYGSDERGHRLECKVRRP